MQGKPCFFVHCGTTFIVPPCTCLVPITCCSYDIQDSKRLAGIYCFLRLRECLFRQLSTCCCSSVFRPNGHGKVLSPLGIRQLWLNLKTRFFCRHIYGCFCRRSQIFLRKNRTTKPTQHVQLRDKKKLLLSRANAPEILLFAVGVNTKPLGTRAWNLSEKYTFQRGRPFPCLLMLTLTFWFQNSWCKPEMRNWPEAQTCTHAQCVLPRCLWWVLSNPNSIYPLLRIIL